VRTFFTIIKGGSLRSPPAARPRRACDPFRPVPARPVGRLTEAEKEGEFS